MDLVAVEDINVAILQSEAATPESVRSGLYICTKDFNLAAVAALLLSITSRPVLLCHGHPCVVSCI